MCCGVWCMFVIIDVVMVGIGWSNVCSMWRWLFDDALDIECLCVLWCLVSVVLGYNGWLM